MRKARLAAALLFLVGCSGGGNANPSQTYERYRQAVRSGDPAQVRTFLSAEGQKELGTDNASREKLKLMAQLMPAKTELKEEKIDGSSATLTVVAKDKGQTMTGTVSMVLEGGAWKVAKEAWNVTIDLSSAEDASAGTGGQDTGPVSSGPFFTTTSDLPKPHLVLEGHQDAVSALAFTPDGELLVSASYGDYSVRLWDPAKGEQRAEVRTKNRVRSLAISPDGTKIYTADVNKDITCYPIQHNELGPPQIILRGAGDALALSPDAKLVAATFFKEPVRIWKLEDASQVKTLPGSEFVRLLRFTPNGRTLVGGGEGNTCVMWDTATWSEKKADVSRVGKESSIADLDISQDNQLLGTAHNESSVGIIELGTGKTRMSLYVRDASTQAVRFSPDGKVLASGNYNNNVYLWDAVKGRRLVPLSAHKSPVSALAFSPDGSTLASGAEDRKIILWRRGKAPTAATKALQPAAKKDPEVKGPELSIEDAKNLLKNASANEGRAAWKTQGEVSIEAPNGNPCFVIRYSGTFMQSAPLPANATYIVAAARASSERVTKGSITGLPYLYGYFVNKKDANRFGGYLNADGLRYDAEVKDMWGVVSAVMKVPPETGSVQLMLQQCSGKEPQNGSAARLDDVGLYAFPDETAAKAFLKKYRAAAEAFNREHGGPVPAEVP